MAKPAALPLLVLLAVFCHVVWTIPAPRSHATLAKAVAASATSVTIPGALATTPALSSTTGFSVVTILKQDADTTGYVLGNSVSDSGDARCFHVLSASANNAVGIFFGEDSGARQTIYRQLSTPIDDGEYHALAVVVEANKLTVFVDGAQQGSSRSLGGVAVNTCTSGSTVLGARSPGNRFPLSGELYSVTLYDTALSEFEVGQESVLPGATPFVPGTQPAEQDLGTSVSSTTALGTVPIVNSGEAFSMTAVDVTLDAGARGYLFANSAGDNDARCFHWFLDSTTNKMAFFWGEHDGGPRQALYLATGIDIDDGSAHTYSFSLSTAGELKIFVDYAQVGSSTTLSPVPQTCPGGVAMVGGRPPSTSSAFDLSGSIGGLTHFNTEKPDLDVAPVVPFVHNGNLLITSSSTTAEIQAWQGVTEVTGYVSIYGTSLTNFDFLSTLTTIGGYLNIHNNDALTSLSGLSALTSIASYFSLSSNDVLPNVDGMTALTSIGANFFCYNNAALTNVDGLSGLTTLGNYLRFENNAALTSVSGMSNVASVGGPLTIKNNAVLTNIDGLNGITSIPYYVLIQNSPALTNVNGLSGLTTVSTYVKIDNNPALANLDGLSALTSVGDYLELSNNGALTNVDGLSALATIGGYLKLYNNDALTNVDGLSALTTIGGYLYLSSNGALANLNGLSALTTITSYFWIWDNDALTNVDGLTALTTIGSSFYVYSNDVLTDLDGLTALTTVTSFIMMYNNNALANVDGLSALTTVGGYIRLRTNAVLASAGPLDAFFSARGCSYGGAGTDSGECAPV